MLRTFLILSMLTGVCLATAGCNILSYIGYAIAPRGPQKTVKAEFDDLPGHSLAVVVYTDESTEFEYPAARLELSMVIAEEFRTTKPLRKVQVIDSRRVAKYQNTNLFWDSMDKTKLGEQLGADYVLLVSVMEFSTREPGSMSLYRGRITGEATLYDTSLPEKYARVWKADEIRVMFPEDAPTGQLSEDDAQIRYQTEKRFAFKLVRHFYTHKVPRNQ